MGSSLSRLSTQPLIPRSIGAIILARAPALIRDDGKSLAFSGEPQDRLDEILPIRAVDPRRAQDYVPQIGGVNAGLACELAAAIGVERRHFILFDIGRALSPVEYAGRGNLVRIRESNRRQLIAWAGRRQSHRSGPANIQRLRSSPPIPGSIARQLCANSALSRRRGGRLSPPRSIACLATSDMP